MTPSPEQGSVHSLAALACLSADQIRRLRGRWIDSVESLAAMTGSDQGRAGLMQLLEITEAAIMMQAISESHLLDRLSHICKSMEFDLDSLVASGRLCLLRGNPAEYRL